MDIQNARGRARWPRRFAGLALPMMLVAGLGACDLDDILDVDDPDVASPESIQDPAALPTVYAGVVRDFTWAYSGTGTIGGGGDNDPIITMSGLLTDEFQHYGTFPTREDIDLRAIRLDGPQNTTTNGTLADAYHNLHRARRAAAFAEDLAVSFDAENTGLRSAISSLEGYSYIIFGEVFCEGVPYSRITLDGEQEFGSPSTRQQTFDLAIASFERAIGIAEAAEDDDALYLAQVGLGRALLNQGEYAAAAAAVADVPSDWEYVVEHSDNSAGQENGVWKYTLDAGRYGLNDSEGGNGLDWSTDPRTPVQVGERDPFDTSIDTYIGQEKYASRDTDVVLASGREARYIEAEAALHPYNAAAFLLNLNAAREADGVDPLLATDIPLTDAGRVDLLFAERGYSLWMTAHRLGDLRRLIRQYGRDSEDVFPSGEFWRDGLEYGTDVNLPIYVDENNNPEFTGCLNRDA